MGKRDISNNADPKQRWRKKDSEKKRSARAKDSYKEKAKRLNYQKEYVKVRDAERLMSIMNLVYVISEWEQKIFMLGRLVSSVKLVSKISEWEHKIVMLVTLMSNIELV